MTTFILLALAALYAGVAYPLVKRRVPPNKTYGLRSRATYADERVWYDANAAGGRDLMVLSAVFGLCAVALPNTDWGFGIAIALVLVGTLVMAVGGSLRASRMLRDRQAEDRALRDAARDVADAPVVEAPVADAPALRRRRTR